MAHLTVNFLVEMSVKIPDEIAARMTKQDVCSSLELAIRSAGGKAPQRICNNEVLGREFSWSIGPKSEELLPKELEFGTFTDQPFPGCLKVANR